MRSLCLDLLYNPSVNLCTLAHSGGVLVYCYAFLCMLFALLNDMVDGSY